MTQHSHSTGNECKQEAHSRHLTMPHVISTPSHCRKKIKKNRHKPNDSIHLDSTAMGATIAKAPTPPRVTDQRLN